MRSLRKGILFIHRWLGLISGLVVFIVSITGCLFCFQDEIQDALYTHRKVETRNLPYLDPSVLQRAALTTHPEGKAGMVTYSGPGRSAQVRVFDEKKNMHFVYLDPYTARVLHDEDPRTNFFIVVEFIHMYLLLPAKIGKVVVGTSVLIFVAIMITGIVLWWPRRKTDRKRSFTIKWKGRWRRVNYDLHNVLGFYATAVALVLALSGLSMSFDWVEKGIYKAANLGRQYPQEAKVFSSDSLYKALPGSMLPIDRAYHVARKGSPTARMFFVFEQAGAAGTIQARAYAQPLRYDKSDIYTFDKYSGKLLHVMPYSRKSLGMKLNHMNYDIHVGQVAGLPGKIIAFLASLICASLPVTGLIIWLGKRNKTKHPRKKRRRIVLQPTGYSA
ncbi:PepSY-associated TM helix domain-containing protein [Arcticibacter sp. MXS-1]|uniref:PepSY-associated TM helix domain-containing protein n=1 Tax=Arcticibacter sp. MXS-1 TaxID=3341726 RepID=UPI0035A9A61E